MEKEKYTAIVLSAGAGSRMHSQIPKQYMDLCGYPVIYYSLKAFEESEVDEIVLVAGKQDVEFCRQQIVMINQIGIFIKQEISSVIIFRNAGNRGFD